MITVKTKFYLYLMTFFFGFAILNISCTVGSSFIRPGTDFRTIGSIAIISNSSGLSGSENYQIANLMTLELLKKGYNVVDGKNINNSKQQLNQNVQAAIVINANYFTSSILISAKMIEIATGNILWIAEKKGYIVTELSSEILEEQQNYKPDEFDYSNLFEADHSVEKLVVQRVDSNKGAAIRSITKQLVDSLPNLLE